MRARRVTQRQLIAAIVLSALLVGAFVYHHIRYARLLETASIMHTEAMDFERKGLLQRAYHRYNALCEGIGIKRSDVPKDACDGARRTSGGVRLAKIELEMVLQRHLDSRGAYPDTLATLEHDLSKATLQTLGGFFYLRQSPNKMILSDGLSFRTFSLSKYEH
jgi:hypothetical protein